LNEVRNRPDSDVDRLSRLKTLSWLSVPELSLLAGTLTVTNFKRREVILHESAPAPEAQILLSGVARLTCRNTRGERVTAALLAPGPIPEFPAPPVSQFAFQCEAYSDCRVGRLGWNDFDSIRANASETAFKKFHENDLKQCYRLLLRSSSLLNLGLHERVAIMLLELCSEFGVEDARGTLLRVSLSHKELANLVGASRPRVTEHLAQLERERFLIRQGRQLVVRADKLCDTVPPILPA
jgi:CRP-like cAMP-binding protein